MTLTQMQYFSAVCRTLNVTHAAKELHLSQPTLSAAIRAMETECGVELFHHRANSLALTDEGLVLLEEITPLLKSYDRIQHVIDEHMLDRKFVRLSFSTIAGGQACPRLCSRYHALYPDVQVLSVEASTEKHYQELELGHVDLILTSRMGTISDEVWNDRYAHIKIENDSPLMFCVSIQHPLACKTSVTYEEIVREPLIVLDDTFSVSKRILRSMAEAGYQPQNTVQCTSQLYTVERFIEENAACGFLPQNVAENNPNLVPLSYPEQRMKPLYLTWLKDKPQFSSVKNFIRMAKKMYPAG